MATIRNRFTFIGKVKGEKAEFKDISKPHWKGHSLKLLLLCGEDGGQFVEFFGGDNLNSKTGKYEIKTFKVNDDEEIAVKDGTPITEELLGQIPRWYKRKAHLTEGEKEFIYQSEWIAYVNEQLKDIEGQIVKVTGEIEFSYSPKAKKTYPRYRANSIELVDEETAKQSARAKLQLYYDQSSVDQNIFEGNKINIPYVRELGSKVTVNAYVCGANSHKDQLDVKELFYPIETVIDLSKIDFAVEKQNRMAHILLRNVLNTTDSITTSAWEVKVVNAQETREYTEDEIEQLLSPEELEYAELWGIDPKDVINKKNGNSVFGERVRELKCFKPEDSMPIKQIAEEVSEEDLSLYQAIKEAVKLDKAQPKKETPKPKVEEKPKEADITADDFEDMF